MRGKLILRACAALLLCLALIPFTAGAKADAAAAKKATVMVYMCGSDLESGSFRSHGQGSRTLKDINKSGFNKENVNAVALLGGTPKWDLGFDGSLLTIAELGGRRTVEADHMPGAPMGDPATMTAFLDYCAEHYPAEKYYLVIWDHGGGPNQGVCFDSLYDNDSLSVGELAQAIGDSTLAAQGLELIAFHTCLTGSMEYAAALAPYAHYMAATEDSMYGLTYDWLKYVDTDASTEETLARLVDDTFKLNEEYYALNNATEINSVTAVDLKKIAPVVEAMDSFFERVVPDVNEKGFPQVSNQRGDSATFGVGESGGSANRDLADLGDLAFHLKDHAPEEAEKLLAALKEAVVYHRTALDACYGLTVYHPYSNKTYIREFMAAHNEIGMSPNYSDYIHHFSAVLTGTPLAAWTNLQTKASVDKDLRVLYTLALTDDQAENTAAARLTVLEKTENGSYRFVQINPDTVIKDGTVTGEFTGSALYAVSAEGEALTLPLEYEITDSGIWQIHAVLTVDGDENAEGGSADAIICCVPDGEKRELVPGGVLLPDEAGGYTGIYEMRFEDFTSAELTAAARKETRDADGTLLGYREWETDTEEKFTLPIDGSWSFRLLADTIPLERLYVTFEVTDVQQNRHISEPAPIQDTGSMGTVVIYDDMGLVKLANTSVTRGQGKINLTAEVTSLADAEYTILAEQVSVNGNMTDTSAELFGAGENWGLLQGETAYLALALDEDALPDSGEEAEITFVLTVKDAVTGETAGTVPVTVKVGAAGGEN